MVAEMSASHLGSLKRAHAIIDAAAEAGADAIKFQTWSPDSMCLDRGYTLTHGPWAGRTLFDLYREAWTPWDWHPELFKHARELGLIPFSAAFDRAAVDFLEDLGVDRHKVASFELTDLPLIRYMASKGKPMILSTGMAAAGDIRAARLAIAETRVPWDAGTTFLFCTSAYPADASDARLSRLGLVPQAGESFGVSDHSLGIGVACAAAALGATYIEKHLTLSRADGGPDAGFSMEPAEFKQLVTECRRAAAAIGVPSYGPGPNESTELRRSLWVREHVSEGEPLSLWAGLGGSGNVVTARPAIGLPPSFDLTGKRAARELPANTPLTADCIA